MKTINSIIIVSLITFVSVVHAQKVFKPASVIEGKTILQYAKEIDVQAFLETTSIYKAGMSETAFITAVLSNFPAEAKSLKEVYAPYYQYIYTLHKRGFNESQVLGAITGNEFANLATNISSWNANNPGVIIESKKWPWKIIVEAAIAVLQIIIKVL